MQPIIYTNQTRPILVAEDIKRQLSNNYIGPSELRVKMSGKYENCGPQQYSASERFMVCPSYDGPLD